MRTMLLNFLLPVACNSPMDHILFMYQLVNIWALSSLGVIMNNAVVDIHWHTSPCFELYGSTIVYLADPPNGLLLASLILSFR